MRRRAGACRRGRGRVTTGEGDEPVVARVTPEAGIRVAELRGMPLARPL